MLRLILFSALAFPILFTWAAFHAFIKKDFAKVKWDFFAGLFFISISVGVSYLLYLS